MELRDRSVISRSLRCFRTKTLNQEGGDILPSPHSYHKIRHTTAFKSPGFVRFVWQAAWQPERLYHYHRRQGSSEKNREKRCLVGRWDKVPSIFFQLYSIHFEQSSDINPVFTVFCPTRQRPHPFARLRQSSTATFTTTGDPDLFWNCCDGVPSTTLSECPSEWMLLPSQPKCVAKRL